MIIKSPIFSKIFTASSLSLADDGLYRRVRNSERNLKHYLFLTDDIHKIVELIGMKFEDINLKPIGEVLPLIVENKYFNPIKFVDKDHDVKDLITMKKYLLDNPDLIVDTGRVPLRTEHIENVLGIKYSDRMNEIKLKLDTYRKTYKNKFESMKVELIQEGFNMRNFNTHKLKFTSSFKERIDRIDFACDATVNEFKERFLNA